MTQEDDTEPPFTNEYWNNKNSRDLHPDNLLRKGPRTADTGMRDEFDGEDTGQDEQTA